MRVIFYLIFSVFLALFGWCISLLILGTLLHIYGFFAKQAALPYLVIENFVVLPVMAIVLSAGMVLIETFLSNPTRYQASFRAFKPYFRQSAINGLVVGVAAALLASILNKINFSDLITRVLAWLLVGLAIGFTEGRCWASKSIEGSTSKGKLRTNLTTIAGALAGLLGALTFEFWRQQKDEDWIGFLALGMWLGLCLSVATISTYQYALRAGRGFEVRGKKINQSPYKIKKDRGSLGFVTEENTTSIEEGLSIQLPSSKFPFLPPSKKEIVIGSDDQNVDIFMPGFPDRFAKLVFHANHWQLISLIKSKKYIVKLQGKTLECDVPKSLKHNYLVTFQDRTKETKKVYNLLFYNRFLDPQA